MYARRQNRFSGSTVILRRSLSGRPDASSGVPYYNGFYPQAFWDLQGNLRYTNPATGFTTPLPDSVIAGNRQMFDSLYPVAQVRQVQPTSLSVDGGFKTYLPSATITGPGSLPGLTQVTTVSPQVIIKLYGPNGGSAVYDANSALDQININSLKSQGWTTTPPIVAPASSPAAASTANATTVQPAQIPNAAQTSTPVSPLLLLAGAGIAAYFLLGK